MWKFWHNNNADAGMVGGVIALLVSIIVGVLIWYKLNSSMYTAFNFPASPLCTTANNATKTVISNVNATGNTVFTLMPIVAIVLIASVILLIVTNFGRGAGA